MKISIITVCFNSALTIEDTLNSVINQTYKDVEYIVVDGNSTDETADILNRYSKNINQLLIEPDHGIYDAMNKGLAMATGEIIGILNSDDLYKSNDVLERVNEAFSKGIECLCSSVEIFEGQKDNVIRFYSSTRWKKWMFRLGHQPPHPGFFALKSCYSKFGNFNLKYRLGADFDLLLRFIGKHNCKTDFQNWASVSMRAGGASQKSLKNIAKANFEVHSSLKENGYFSLPIMVWLKYPLKVFQYFLK